MQPCALCGQEAYDLRCGVCFDCAERAEQLTETMSADSRNAQQARHTSAATITVDLDRIAERLFHAGKESVLVDMVANILSNPSGWTPDHARLLEAYRASGLAHMIRPLA